MDWKIYAIAFLTALLTGSEVLGTSDKFKNSSWVGVLKDVSIGAIAFLKGMSAPKE